MNMCKNVFDNPYIFSVKRYQDYITNNIHEMYDIVDS
jgi:hypothetical protein